MRAASPEKQLQRIGAPLAWQCCQCMPDVLPAKGPASELYFPAAQYCTLGPKTSRSWRLLPNLFANYDDLRSRVGGSFK
jgi:hypothetical protein